MSFSKPLSYDALKTVLFHMDANKRIEIAKYCPTTRKTEKVVPLRLKYLYFHNRSVKINDTIYKLGSFRKYDEGVEVPPLHQSEINNGGSHLDLDEYGAPERYVKDDLLPGDILIKEQIKDNRTDQAIIDDIKRVILRYQAWNHLDFDFHFPDDFDFDEDFEFPEDFDSDSAIRDKFTEVQQFLNRRDNIFPPYKVMIQLTVRSSNFRRVAIRVNRLELSPDIEILRLPIGLKFKVRELAVQENILDNYGALELTIGKDPLEILDITKEDITEDDLGLQMVKTAKKLVLESDLYPMFFSGLSNFEVHLKNVDRADCIQIFRNVLAHWKNHGREVGSSFSMTLNYGVLSAVKDQLIDIGKQLGGVEYVGWPILVHVLRICIFLQIPFDGVNEIQISCELKKKENDEIRYVEIVKIAVVPLKSF